MPGFFDGSTRALVVAAGLLALVWVPRVRVPAPLHRAVAVVAGASLWIFLTHFAAFPLLRPHVEPVVLFVVAFPIGIAAAALVARAVGPVTRLARTAAATVWPLPAPGRAASDGARSGQPALSTGG